MAAPTPTDRVLEKIRAALPLSDGSALTRLIEEEARALVPVARTSRRSYDVDAEALSFYVEDILEYLGDPRPLAPDDILHYRRRAGAWAIAEKLREQGVTAELLRG